MSGSSLYSATHSAVGHHPPNHHIALQLSADILRCICLQKYARQVQIEGATAYLTADQVGTKLVGSHGHLQWLVVLCWDVYVAHEQAAMQFTRHMSKS